MYSLSLAGPANQSFGVHNHASHVHAFRAALHVWLLHPQTPGPTWNNARLYTCTPCIVLCQFCNFGSQFVNGGQSCPLACPRPSTPSTPTCNSECSSLDGPASGCCLSDYHGHAEGKMIVLQACTVLVDPKVEFLL